MRPAGAYTTSTNKLKSHGPIAREREGHFFLGARTLTATHRGTEAARSTLLAQELGRRILIIDGAMGTMIQRHELGEDDFRGERFADRSVSLMGANDILCLTQPVIIQEIHAAYARAGADLIETNTFNANRISLADYRLEDVAEELNITAAKLARAAADEAEAQHPDRTVWVVGALGPTNRTASISPDVEDPGARNVTFDELVVAYSEQAHGLLRGGSDILTPGRHLPG